MYRNVKMPKARPPPDFADDFDVDSPDLDSPNSWYTIALSQKHRLRQHHHYQAGPRVSLSAHRGGWLADWLAGWVLGTSILMVVQPVIR
ncbi:hypothetical protein Pmani_037433 [Petrolisthes manimaculis]|uniref:Uncharacterized protein n=1 Tax=Petrolisthes manimaculis TaxID=1843537 RepID=A0AAE1TNB2_9EUCA|nr:hypothetical protein Pmani_037433 [Petrolisthes manimaculis]